MLRPHNVSNHEKRKALQIPQVGEGMLQTAAHLMIPLLRKALKV